MRRLSWLVLIILIVSVNVSVIEGQNRKNNFLEKPIVQASSYEVSGNRSGQVTVKDKVSGRVIRTFQMQEAVVRETFILDNGQTVAASQKDHAVFWNLNTGREIRRFDERIYGFSHDESKFFTYNPQKIGLYSYPEFKPVCQFNKLFDGPERFIFSPDDRFLAVGFYKGRPAIGSYVMFFRLL